MTDVSKTQEMPDDHPECAAEERSHRVTAAAWLAGVSAFLAFANLDSDATVGAGIAFVGIASMVAVVCYYILRVR